MPDTLRARVGRVIFEKDGYYIMSVDVLSSTASANKVETVRGPLYGLSTLKRGVTLQLTGRWQKHPKYGRQFSVQSWEPWAETNLDIEWFLSVCIPGFLDPRFTSCVVQALGSSTFRMLTERGGELQENPPEGVDPVRLADALLGWESALATRDLSELLKAGGISATDIQAAIIRFGTSAPAIIRENPYRLMEIPSFSYPRADKLAMSLGISTNDPRRLEGAVLWALQHAGLEGHLFLRRSEIVKRVVELFHEHDMVGVAFTSDPNEVFEKTTEALIERKALILEPGYGVYLPEQYRFERESAQLLAAKITPSPIEVDLPQFLEDYERRNKITLSEAQKSAVEQLASSRVMVLTGLPGTGKTTSVRALVRLFEEAGLSFALMAPTGIAAKRLAALTGHSALTIHRALKYDGTRWLHSASNRYIIDAVIVDEMSMVDQELFYRLLSSLRPETMVVLVGDDAQLPSVGPGNVLRELIECSVIPSVRLTQIFRQSEKGEIVINSHKINRGEMLTFSDPRADTEFKFARSSDEERIVDFIVDIAAKLKSRNENFQVLSPKYDGAIGVNNLNDRLRDRLNPEGPKEWKVDNIHFRLGDRLMVTRNDYKLGVYNGDVGKLVGINKDSLIVKIHGVGEGGMDMEVEFTEAQAVDKLRLAYAITVHKSQGSEFDTIILPITKAQGRMLQRNLFYTAVTRARKRVWVLGEEAAIQQAISNNKVVRRNTALSKAVLDAHAAGVAPSHEVPADGAPEGAAPGS